VVHDCGWRRSGVMAGFDSGEGADNRAELIVLSAPE
jgi:hypothetical protein